ncbi:winged helix-turn-helix transcriptional regulator [Umezawaea sp. Da 62-37]|uniref:winged helix-turn-helix transcriptional regulator n=1 Tax=Umezawaea sp. Da 62-37 TaxID=3075927 RepID=UPI0028F73F31|nr:winged helix-turn-helix transcriptional regulator [Umezawaea sp. Da 62-37]WNV90209.1 winged helix-turn-helix transcriptional regulator [Umezawaea sp. Da 62-37]
MTERDDRVLRGLYDLKNLFGDKWVPAILVALRDGPLRRVEILSTVNSYSIDENWTDKHAVLHDSIFARTLKKMREQGLIDRHSCDKTFPPEVLYSLTPAVAEVLTLAEPLIEWTRAHPELLSQAQSHSRQSGADASILDDVVELAPPADTGRFHASGRRPRAGGAVG